MRETLAWRALREMGVPSALSYQVRGRRHDFYYYFIIFDCALRDFCAAA